MPPDAILFDLDCTLTDRRATVDRFAREFVGRYGSELLSTGVSESSGAAGDRPPFASEIAKAITSADRLGYRPRAEFFGELRSVLPWRRAPAASDLQWFWHARFPPCTCPAQGLYDTVGSLRSRGIKLGVVTNGQADMQRRKVLALGLGQELAVLVISGEAGVSKPDRRIFHLALRCLGVEPARAYFVGDHPVNDVLGARAAGLEVVWVRGMQPWPPMQQPPALQITALPELLSLLAMCESASPATPS